MAQERLAAALKDRYRVERELGSGGMATVYLATDLKHERRVALKVLHPELAAVLGAERFLAEIKTTAHLQHPNILQLFDSGIADGLLYYVMPFVEGETLRARLARERQLPVDDAIRIATGVAAALDYAHRHGVIHRDIKPENILLQDGQPLVADFGIALAVRAAGGVRLTQTGLSLGTPQYMSPEQATGEREIDGRTDVYALGAVLYELLAGEPPFTGPSSQAIIARLMTDEPRALSAHRRAVPPHVEAAVHRALEKLPADRFSTAAQFAEAVAREGGTTTGFSPRGGSRRAARWTALPAAVALGVAGVLLGHWLGRQRARDGVPAVPTRLALLAGDEAMGLVGLVRVLAISPDGETVAYLNGRGEVRVRRLSESSSTTVADGATALDLTFAPDGRTLYGTSPAGHLVRIPLAGGAATPLPDITGSPHLAWEPDGALWVSPHLSVNGVQRIPAGAGRPETRFMPDSLGRNLLVHQILPDRRTALVTRVPRSGNSGESLLLDLASGATTQLLDFPVVESRLAGAHLVFVRPDGSLHAIGLDLTRRRVVGEPVQLADDVALTGNGLAEFAVSATGTIVYLPTQPSELVLVDRSGAARSVTEPRWAYHSPRFAPDGRRIAVDFTTAEGRDVWVLDLEDRTMSRETLDRDGHDPVWSPDGRWIYYTSNPDGRTLIRRVRPGAGATADSTPLSGLRWIGADSGVAWTGAWLPDGSGVVTTVFAFSAGRNGADIMKYTPGDSAAPTPLVASPFEDWSPAVSPDGKWLAFVSDRSGRAEVYVQPIGAGGTQTQISLDGGGEPLWGKNGAELFYRRTVGTQVELVRATVQTSPRFRVLDRTPLFLATPYEAAETHTNYDIAPDGRSFIMVRRAATSHLVVIQHLAELMRRKAR